MWIFKVNMYIKLNYEISIEELDFELKCILIECCDIKI